MIIVGNVLRAVFMIYMLVRYLSKLKLKFKNREGAANILAEILKPKLKNLTSDYHEKPGIVVIGVPRGGLIIADIVANRLLADIDIIIAMKIGSPHSKEIAIGSVAEDGTVYIDQKQIDKLQVSDDYIKKEIFEVKEEITERANTLRRMFTKDCCKIKDKIVILVDDGSATGATVICAARALKKNVPKKLIIAVPVAPSNVMNLLKEEADLVVVITVPSSSDFMTVGQYYEDFSPVNNTEINKIVDKRKTIHI